MSSKQTLYFLVGPTASGKSELGVALAKKLGAEILSLDSMQVYRGMDIGTAKLSLNQREGVGHYLLYLVDPWESFSVADYRKHAQKTLREIEERGKRALFVGGTALYLKVLTHGLFEGTPTDPRIREELAARAEKEGDEAMHRELSSVDPLAASRIHPNDRKRILRALEVFRLTGSAISDLQREWSNPKEGPSRKILGLQISRETLHRRVQERVQRMLQAGWVEEVESILKSGGFGPQSSKALGYPEIINHLEGKADLEKTAERITQKTRVFVRRQMTWLRSFPDLIWLDAEDRKPAPLLEEALKKIEASK